MISNAKAQKNKLYMLLRVRNHQKCKKHIIEGMINVKAHYCIDDRCKEKPKCASFNLPNEKKPLYCKTHKIDGMVDVTHKSRQCIHIEDDESRCKKLAYYNYEGEKPLYCKIHIPDKENMVDVFTNFCEKCKTTASYNYPDEKHARFCTTHAKDFPGMIDITGKTKQCDDCKSVQASFNYKGLKAKYCVKCAKKRNILMIDVRSSKCIECKKGQRIYNHVGEKPEYCGDCKKDDMVDTLSKKCIKCKEYQPNFNFKGESALYCSGCAKPGMINVKKPRCTYKDINGECEFVAHYNYIGTKVPLFCGIHRDVKIKISTYMLYT
jgi:hypothetical protein